MPSLACVFFSTIPFRKSMAIGRVVNCLINCSIIADRKFVPSKDKNEKLLDFILEIYIKPSFLEVKVYMERKSKIIKKRIFFDDNSVKIQMVSTPVATFYSPELSNN